MSRIAIYEGFGEPNVDVKSVMELLRAIGTAFNASRSAMYAESRVNPNTSMAVYAANDQMGQLIGTFNRMWPSEGQADLGAIAKTAIVIRNAFVDIAKQVGTPRAMEIATGVDPFLQQLRQVGGATIPLPEGAAGAAGSTLTAIGLPVAGFFLGGPLGAAAGFGLSLLFKKKGG